MVGEVDLWLWRWGLGDLGVWGGKWPIWVGRADLVLVVGRLVEGRWWRGGGTLSLVVGSIVVARPVGPAMVVGIVGSMVVAGKVLRWW